MSRDQGAADLVSIRALFLVHRWPPSPCVLVWERARELCGVSCKVRTLTPFMGAPPSCLITSRGSHLL